MLVILQGMGPSQDLIGQGYLPAPGVTRYTGAVLQSSPTTILFLVNDTNDFFGVDPAVAVAAGDTLAFDLLVELE